VQAGEGPQWEKARDLAEEVMKLYAEIFPRDNRPPRRKRSAAGDRRPHPVYVRSAGSAASVGAGVSP
jgi:hypothetical protein